LLILKIIDIVKSDVKVMNNELDFIGQGLALSPILSALYLSSYS